MRRLLTLFIALALVWTPVFSQKKDVYKVNTVVIDPGHGGAKPGAIGGRTAEKTLVLSIAKKFGKLISDNYPDVKVIYTRTTDVDISLAERAHIANRNKADLFVSIHANSHPTSTPTGVETFVMGLSESRANLEVAKKENADILLESDYKSNEAYKGFDPNSPESFVMLAMYQNAFIDKSLNFAQAIQNQYKRNLKTINRGVKQAELFVLYKTTCPSVLTEVGFISNPAEEAFMMSDEGQAKIAISLFNAFMNFKATEEGSSKIANPKIDLPGYESPKKTTEVVPEPAPVVEVQPAPEPAPAVVDTPVVAMVTVAERPVPSPDLAPKVEKPAEASQALNAPQDAKDLKDSSDTKSTEPLPLAAPKNTAVSAVEFFTVQVLTSNSELREGDPAFQGLTDVISTRNGKLYCYSVGRFSNFTEADEYSAEVRKNTPFKDAWAVRRKLTAPIPETAPAPQDTKVLKDSKDPNVSGDPKDSKAPKVSNAPKAPTPKPGVKPEDKGTHYRIQLCSVSRYLKVGDPDLHGIKDINRIQNGKYYIYSCGNYTSLSEARKRLASIKKDTPFKDAFIFGIKDGHRFNIE